MWDFSVCKKIFLCWILHCVIETLPPLLIQTPPVATEEEEETRSGVGGGSRIRIFSSFFPSQEMPLFLSGCISLRYRGNSCVQRQNFPIENKSYETIFYRLRKGDFLRLKRGGEKEGWLPFSMQKLQFLPGGIPDLDSIFCQDLQQKSHWTNERLLIAAVAKSWQRAQWRNK